MNEYPLTITTLDSSTCYPQEIQKLLDVFATYSSVIIDDVLQPYSVSSEAPNADASQNPWAQTESTLSGYGTPRVIRLYANGQWREFSQFSQGDAILVPSYANIVAPWGEVGKTYLFGNSGVPSYTPTFNPTAPQDYKYKIYVGYYSSYT